MQITTQEVKMESDIQPCLKEKSDKPLHLISLLSNPILWIKS